MKKRILLPMMVLVLLFFCSCEFMCVKNVYSTYLIFEDIMTSDIKVFCKSEKLEVVQVTECELVTNYEKITFLKNNNLISNDSSKIFYIPTGSPISDHTDVNIFFEVYVNEELYTGELYMKTLNTKKNGIDKVPVKLELQNGEILLAEFTFDLDLIL